MEAGSFLIEIFKAEESACEYFLNGEFTYLRRNWNNGTKWSVSLTESVEYSIEPKKKEMEKKNTYNLCMISIFF